MTTQIAPLKRFYLSVILLTILANCMSQEHPLITENKIWCNQITEYWEQYPGPLSVSHFIKTDSVFVQEGFYSACDLLRSDREDMTDWYPYGSLEQHYESQKVFYYDARGWRYLLYDFGVVKGDTVQVYDGEKLRFNTFPTWVEYSVDSIDTISILGVERKRILLTSQDAGELGYPYGWGASGLTEPWISGIGSLSGLQFNNHCDVGCDQTKLRCVSIGDSLLYKREGITSCYYSNHVGVPEAPHVDSQVEIYPNPVKDFITIKSETSNRYSIDITSLNGQLIHYSEMEGAERQINLSSYQKGVYFITIRSKDFVTTRKIIKL